MNRLTTKISNANNFCKYELKNAKYRYLFDLTSNKQIEDYVDANLTIAIDELGKIEDIEEELGCPLEVVFKALKQMYVCHKEKIKIELLGVHIKSNELYLYGFVEDTSHAIYLNLKDYAKTWALTREELEENETNE